MVSKSYGIMTCTGTKKRTRSHAIAFPIGSTAETDNTKLEFSVLMQRLIGNEIASGVDVTHLVCCTGVQSKVVRRLYKNYWYFKARSQDHNKKYRYFKVSRLQKK